MQNIGPSPKCGWALHFSVILRRVGWYLVKNSNKKSWTVLLLKSGPTELRETSVNSYQSLPHTILEERRPQYLQRSRNDKRTKQTTYCNNKRWFISVQCAVWISACFMSSRNPLIRIGLTLRVHLSRILQNWRFEIIVYRIKYSTVLSLLELRIRSGRKVQMQVRTVNSNSRTSNCQCSLFSEKNPIIRNLCISGWLAVPINPNKWSFTVLTNPPITVGVMWIRKLKACGSVPIPTKPWTKVLGSLKHNCQSSTPANYCQNTVLLLFLSLLPCLSKETTNGV